MLQGQIYSQEYRRPAHCPAGGMKHVAGGGGWGGRKGSNLVRPRSAVVDLGCPTPWPLLLFGSKMPLQMSSSCVRRAEV